MSRKPWHGVRSGTRRRPQQAADTLSTARLWVSEKDLVDEEGEPLPPRIRRLIMKLLGGAPVGEEMKERLAAVNEQLEQCIEVCKAGCIPINMESVLLEVCEMLESFEEELS